MTAKRWVVVSGALFFAWGKRGRTWAWVRMRKDASTLLEMDARTLAALYWGGDILEVKP
jgi:hypothetical protein